MLCPAETNTLNPHLEQIDRIAAIQTQKNISVHIGWPTNIIDWSACPDHLFLHPGSHNFPLPALRIFTAHVIHQEKPGTNDN